MVLNLSAINCDLLYTAIDHALSATRASGTDCAFSLPIVSTEEGLEFSSSTANSGFFTEHGLEQGMAAQDAFRRLRQHYSIPAGMADTDAARVIALYVSANNHGYAYRKMEKKN